MNAKDTLEAMRAEAGESPEHPSPEGVWRVFVAFAHRPVAAGRPLQVEDDMCLLQWGVYDWGQGPQFEYDLTR